MKNKEILSKYKNKNIFKKNAYENYYKLISPEIYSGDINESILSEKSFLECPWVSTDYFETKVKVNTDIIIPFYITDWTQAEYIYDDDSKEFVLEIYKEGEETTKYKVKAGSYSINVGSFSSTGIKTLTIQVTDLSNMIKSHKEVIDIYVIDESYEITEEQTYIMTEEDLTTYSIDNTNNEDEATRIANSGNITTFLQSKRDEGYRKVVMLPGTYRMDCQGSRDNAVWVPSGLTVDGNGCKIKQHVYYSAGNSGSACIIRSRSGCFDSHIRNMHIEGDYDEHYLGPRYDEEGNRMNPGVEAEAYSGICFGGAFCSIDNVEMSYISSYALGGGSTVMAATQNMNQEMLLRKINIETGEEEESSDFMVSDYRDVANFDSTGWMNPENAMKYKYIGAGTRLGYMGFAGHTDKYYVFYYDENKNYLGYEKGLQFGKVPKPDNLKFIRLMLLGNTDTLSQSGINLYSLDFLSNTSVSITNFYAHNTRSCLTYPAYDRVLFKNCRFKNLAEEDEYKVTKWGFDNEDGSYWGHNFYFIDNKFETIPGTTGQRTFNMIHGVNVVFRNNKNLSNYTHWQGAGLYIDDNVYTFKKYDSKSTYGTNRFFRVSPKSKFVQSNLYEQESGYDKYAKYKTLTVIKNLIFPNALEVGAGNKDALNPAVYYESCKIIGQSIEEASYGVRSLLSSAACKNCDITLKEQTYSSNNNATYLENCTIKSYNDTLISFNGGYTLKNCELENLNINGSNSSMTAKIYDSKLTNCKSPLAYWNKGESILLSGCEIYNNKVPLFNRAFYAKYNGSIIENCNIVAEGVNLIVLEDDRVWEPTVAEGQDPPEVVPMLTLIENTITMDENRTVVSGISSTAPTNNQLILNFKNNTSNANLYPESALTNPKITINNLE